MPAFRTTHSTGSARTSRTFASAAAIALAALALTACQSGTGTKDEGAATTSGTVASTPSASGTGKAQDGTSGKGTQGAAGQDSPQTAGGEKTAGGKTADRKAASGDAKKTSGTSNSDSRVLCNGSNTRVTVQPVTRPLNHMLITVRNIGSKTCDLTYYPILRFDEMQWAPTAWKDSQPQAVVTLQPGESGYAGALLSAADGSGDGGDTGHRLVVAFQGLTPNSDGGASAVPSLPAKGVYYDSSLRVTYWQQTMADALNS
ncbi:DUF4232 domain-containing protein [Streptomyces sp. NPDC048419]|uniref:DUF4232 domain-containing protein n=1 Tax=Streptomyces sp. NPDC048419 TaxID=3365547 RepID=UPI0037100557